MTAAGGVKTVECAKHPKRVNEDGPLDILNDDKVIRLFSRVSLQQWLRPLWA